MRLRMQTIMVDSDTSLNKFQVYDLHVNFFLAFVTTTCALDSRILPEMFTLQVYKPLSRTLDLVTFKMDRDFRWPGKLNFKNACQVGTFYCDRQGYFLINSSGLEIFLLLELCHFYNCSNGTETFLSIECKNISRLESRFFLVQKKTHCLAFMVLRFDFVFLISLEFQYHWKLGSDVL